MSADDDDTVAYIAAKAQVIIDCDPEELARMAAEDPEKFTALAKAIERTLLDTATRTRPRSAMTAAERITATKVRRPGRRK